MGVDGLGLWFEVWGLGHEGQKSPRNEVKWTRVFPRGYLVLTDDWLVWLQARYTHRRGKNIPVQSKAVLGNLSRSTAKTNIHFERIPSK